MAKGEIVVVATEFGFYGNKKRREGEEFVIKSKDDFSSKWMSKKEEYEPPKKKVVKEKSTLSEIGLSKSVPDGKPTGSQDVL